MEWQKPPPRDQGNHQQFKPLSANLAATVIFLGAIAKCEEAAKKGIEDFGRLWMSFTQEERQIIGNDEKDRIKNSIAIDAEYSEVK